MSKKRNAKKSEVSLQNVVVDGGSDPRIALDLDERNAGTVPSAGGQVDGGRAVITTSIDGAAAGPDVGHVDGAFAADRPAPDVTVDEGTVDGADTDPSVEPSSQAAEADRADNDWVDVPTTESGASVPVEWDPPVLDQNVIDEARANLEPPVVEESSISTDPTVATLPEGVTVIADDDEPDNFNLDAFDVD